MNKKLLLDALAFVLFSTVLVFVGILSISHNFVLSQTQHEIFENSVLSIEFLHFVPVLTLTSIAVLFCVLMIKNDVSKPTKKEEHQK